MMKEKLQLADMRTEYQKHPLGMDEEHPRFSWKLVSETPDVKQTAYRIIVRCKEESVWDTKKKGRSGIGCGSLCRSSVKAVYGISGQRSGMG